MGKKESLLGSFVAGFALMVAVGSQAFAETPASHAVKELEKFSYCSNGVCRLIDGEYFHNARGMPVDLKVSCKKNNQYALTFDDGPSQHYPKLLEILKQNDVKATFFIVGSNLQSDESKQWFKQAFADGHFMANHTFNHDDLTQLNETSMIATIEKARNAMMSAVFVNQHEANINLNDKKRLELSSRVIRPPFGNIDMNVDGVFKSHGYTSVRWNADRYDWNMPGDDPKTTQIILDRVRYQLDYITENVSHGAKFNQSIMDLNHDWQPTTVDGIQDLIAIVKSHGYEFVTMDECLGMK